jgi:tetratricopeptide (TPR) repeat protein
VEALDRGLKCFFTPEAPNDVGKELQGDQIILDMHLDRGLYLWRSGKRDEALDAYNKTRKFRGDATIGGYNLDDITVIIDEMDSASGGHQLMEALKSWTEKERFDWFEFNLEYGADVTALGRMYRAAKATGETDLVLEWLNAYGKTLSPASSLLFNLKYAVAAFYNRILDDKDKTKEILRQTLAIRPKDDGGNEGDIFNERISEVRASLASIIFSQFRESSDPQRKEALFEEMKNLPGMKTEDEFQESHIGMLVVNM